MALTAEQITAQNFKDFYTQILPYLNKGNGGTSDTPIGQVAFFDDLVAPYGWLVADGTVYNIADYPDLANQYERVHGSKNYWGGDGTTTFAVPNWQGEFLRASGTNSHANQGSGAAVGVHQNGTEVPYTVINYIEGTANNVYFSGDSSTASGAVSNKVINKDSGIPSTTYADVSVTKDGRILRTGSYDIRYTSRPTNTSLLCCVKAIPSSEMNVYSLTEKPAGTWIDGKPLYQKTVSCGALTGNKTIAHGISDLEKVIEVSGYMYNSTSGLSFPLPYVTTRADYQTEFKFDATSITITCSIDLGMPESYITVRYTKTTD